jgi:hypothetical protein
VITIDHGNNEFTCYLHVSPYDVARTRGQSVVQGGVFHRSGNNGWSDGPHLHFEVWKNGQRIDPGPWLANIKPGGDMAADANFVNNVYVGTLMRKEQPYDPATGVWRDPGAKVWVGQPENVVLQKVLESPERKEVEKKYNSSGGDFTKAGSLDGTDYYRKG